MLHLGAHMTTGKGFDRAAKDACSIQADAMQVFTRNPRGGKARALTEKELQKLAEYRDSGLCVVCHAPYTINLASSSDDVREFGQRTIAEDLQRMQLLGASGLVVHSGAHTGAGKAVGLERLIASLDLLLPQVADGTRILLETMSGSGSELGSNLEELQQVLKAFDYSPALGVCLDTCHLFAAGYDVCDWPTFKARFEAYLPWEAVGCIHMNDSKTPFASHKDRHEKLGEGSIGWPAFKQIVQIEADSDLPIIMETPNELSGWAAEIAELRECLNN